MFGIIKKNPYFSNLNKKETNMIEYFLNDYVEGIAFQIISQSDQLTNFVRARGTITTSNGWRVTTDQHPEVDLKRKVIFLRGKDSDMDNHVSIEEFTGLNTKDVGKTIEAIKKAITEVGAMAKRPPRVFQTQEVYLIDASRLRDATLCNSIRRDNPSVIIINQ